jgi:predicted transcriptional regulator
MPKFDDTSPVVGDELRFIRLKYGLSLTSAATMLGTTRHYLRKVEAGDRPCKLLYAKKYEQAIGPKWFKMIRKLYVEQQTKKPIAHVPGLNDDQFLEKEG